MADDDLEERLSRRFGNSQDDETADESQNKMKSQSSQNAVNNQKSQKSQKTQKTQNIKKEWNVRSFYLDDDLDSSLSTAFKRLDLTLAEADSEITLKKTRHFYPLLVELGLERLEEMDVTEVTERLEEMDSG